MIFGKKQKSLLEEAIDETRLRGATPNHQVDYVRRAIDRRKLLLLWGCILLAAILMLLAFLLSR